ncbi:MAG: hypothetical protein OXF74_02800 [Rhodobacteraceae bacterium]|nr:hypothetical protein [Paracoccaceae bacterium]
MPIPPDLHVFKISDPGGSGGKQVVVMDGSFTDAFGSFPPDWVKRTREIAKFGDMILYVIDPVDLAVSKVARFGERDREDIRELAKSGLVGPHVFVARAEEALSNYVGDLTFVCHNLADAKKIVVEAIQS